MKLNEISQRIVEVNEHIRVSFAFECRIDYDYAEHPKNRHNYTSSDLGAFQEEEYERMNDYLEDEIGATFDYADLDERRRYMDKDGEVSVFIHTKPIPYDQIDSVFKYYVDWIKNHGETSTVLSMVLYNGKSRPQLFTLDDQYDYDNIEVTLRNVHKIIDDETGDTINF